MRMIDGIPADEMALARDIARVEAKNAKFEKMTPAQQRVAIAKDVLTWLRMGRFKAERGTYCSIRDEDGHLTDAEELNGHNCHVCALGAVFVAATQCPGAPSLAYAAGDSDNMRRALEPYFSRKQLMSIEIAFESFPEGFAQYKDDRAYEFCLGMIDDRERMEKIMRNIIANKGTFIP